jgi:hypothetical protein
LFNAEVFAQLLARGYAIAVADRRHVPALHRRELERPVIARRAPTPRAVAASMLAHRNAIVV